YVYTQPSHPPSSPTRRSSDFGTCFLLKICLKTEGLRSKSPSGGRPFRKSGNVGSLAGISILSSRAVRIVHPAASFCANLANSDLDRKSTRLNSSHGSISYAVF